MNFDGNITVWNFVNDRVFLFKKYIYNSDHFLTWRSLSFSFILFSCYIYTHTKISIHSGDRFNLVHIYLFSYTFLDVEVKESKIYFIKLKFIWVICTLIKNSTYHKNFHRINSLLKKKNGASIKFSPGYFIRILPKLFKFNNLVSKLFS